MPEVHSHYENLRVARNAPPEVIRAAYKALSQRHHPDLNPGDAEAARIMSVINVAYHTLSDPARRREHDLWLAQAEAQTGHSETARTQVEPDAEPSPPQRKLPSVWESWLPFEVFAIPAHLRKRWPWYLIAGLVFWIASHNAPAPIPAPVQKPYVSQPPAPLAIAQPLYVRPERAPNGLPWPVNAGYINGYPRLHKEGRSTVTVDNTKNDTDVFVKLVSIGGEKAYPIRQFYIPALSQFTVTSVRSGEYDVRYRDLRTGRLSRTEPFVLTQVETDRGIRYETITMTLYKVRAGNMHTYEISESEFN